MKILSAIAPAAILFGAALIVAAPAAAQDRENAPKEQMGRMSDMPDASRKDARPAMRHQVSRHKAAYTRTYKTDEEEHQQTEDLNRQYRGGPR